MRLYKQDESRPHDRAIFRYLTSGTVGKACGHFHRSPFLHFIMEVSGRPKPSSWSVGPGTAGAIPAVYKMHVFETVKEIPLQETGQIEREKALGVFPSEFAWTQPSFGKTSEGRPASGEYVLLKVTVMQIWSCMWRPQMDKTGPTGTKVERWTMIKKKEKKRDARKLFLDGSKEKWEKIVFMCLHLVPTIQCLRVTV